MFAGRPPSGRVSRRTRRSAALQEHSQGEILSEFNSFFRRTVTRRNPTVIHEESDRKRGLLCDFLGLITAINGLYSQQDALPMQQIDTRGNQHVGAGAVFEVATITAKSTRPSQTVANEVEQENKSVIVKRSPLEMFTNDGKLFEKKEHQQAAASFIMELRVLSFPAVRSCVNIVTLLGVGWEYGLAEGRCPWPSLILERAYSTLADFQHKNPNLPYMTKQLLCADVANGISALHDCGIIHGDVKLDNILIFETHRFVAKVADFSHAMLDTGEKTYLIGGTAWYTAPEWQEKLPTSLLIKTDVYSFGLVFASTILGYDVVENFLAQPRNGRTPEARAENLSLKKKEGKLKDYIVDLMYGLYDVDLFSGLDYIPNVQSILDLTLQVDPLNRDLQSVIRRLSHFDDTPPTQHDTTVLKQIDADILAVPYQAMKNTSHCLKLQVVRSLEAVAIDVSDDRNAAACWELCICYIAGLGVEPSHAVAMSWLAKSAERNDPWGRSMIHRLGVALGQEIPKHLNVDEWLHLAAKQGSEVARQSLEERGLSIERRDVYRAQIDLTARSKIEALRNARVPDVKEEESDELAKDLRFPQDSRGNTNLHLAVLSGDQKMIEILALKELSDRIAALNTQNVDGDTALHLACKMGDAKLVKSLLGMGADALAVNGFGENCLHHLTCFSDADAVDIAYRLFRAGVDSTAEASASSMTSEYKVYPDASGCAKVRAILVNRPSILDLLLSEESSRKDTMNEKQRRMFEITPRKLLAWSCRTSNIAALEVLYKHSPETFAKKTLNEFEMWIDGRRFSLAALATAGCVGERPSVGFNYPELFQRYLVYGSAAHNQFERTFGFLRDRGLDFHLKPCFGHRNALFFAIEEARPEVVDHLLSQVSDSHEFAVFGPPIPSKEDKSVAKVYTVLEGDEHGVKHRAKVPLIQAIELAIHLDNRDILRSLLRFRNGEALDPGTVFPVSFDNRLKRASLFSALRRMGKKKNFQQAYPRATNLFPPLHNQIGMADTPPGLVSRSKREMRASSEDVYDGKLNYGVLFMGLIAGADCRDIGLATVLLDQIKWKGETGFQSWAVRNPLEQCSFPGVYTSPLLMSALYGWDGLTELLLANGADTRANTSPMNDKSKRSLIGYLLDAPRFTDEIKPGVEWPVVLTDRNRVLRATISFLTAISRPEAKSEPLHVSDLKVLVRSVYFFSDLQSSELWGVVGEVYRVRSWFSAKQMRTVMRDAVECANHHAIKTMAELGYPLEGTLKDQLFGTPLDALEQFKYYTSQRGGRSVDQLRQDVQRCAVLIRENGGHRSCLYSLEAQIVGNLLSLAILSGLFYAIFGTVEYQHNACINLLERWYRDYRDGSITPWALIFRIPFAYTPFLPFVLMILILIIFILVYYDDHTPYLFVHTVNLVLRLLFMFSYYTLDSFARNPDWVTRLGDGRIPDQPNRGVYKSEELVGPTWRLMKPLVHKWQQWNAKKPRGDLEDALKSAADENVVLKEVVVEGGEKVYENGQAHQFGAQDPWKGTDDTILSMPTAVSSGADAASPTAADIGQT